jgi:hypothetical protein
MLTELMARKAYLLFWTGIAVLFFGVSVGILRKLYEIADLLRGRTHGRAGD